LLYVSTRGQAPRLDFAKVLLEGLASDGGLYVPESWPALDDGDFQLFAGRPYHQLALAILMPFVGKAVGVKELARMVEDSYATFAHPAVVPLRQVDTNDWLLELFHGPTLAFKDVALQLLGRLFDHVLKGQGQRITIVGATSGDTGSAAIEGCRGRDAMDLFILHPHGRTSEVQRRQMTTVPDGNVFNIAVEGTFDDCQAMVKALFNDPAARETLQLSAVNSINWARIAAQIVYYFAAALALGGAQMKTARGTRQRRLAFVVPTGNFGDIYAGHAAAEMGLPIEQLIVATNRNDILARFFATGEYRMEQVAPTISPSMDIQVSSNFERLLFDLVNRDAAHVQSLMDELRDNRGFAMDRGYVTAAARRFSAGRASEEETLAAMAETYRTSGHLVDPHTAVGLHVARAMRKSGRLGPHVPVVTLATAAPAKFPDAVERATGQRPPLPARLADLYERKERFDVLPNSLDAVRAYIMERARIARGAN